MDPNFQRGIQVEKKTCIYLQTSKDRVSASRRDWMSKVFAVDGIKLVAVDRS